MPANSQSIGQTTPKTGTAQYQTRRISGLPLIIPSTLSPLPAFVPNRRFGTIQEDAAGNQYFVLGFKAYSPDVYTTYAIIQTAILEQASQSGFGNQTTGAPNQFANGDRVTVISGAGLISAVEFEASHQPSTGIAVTSNTVDNFGRLTNRAADTDHKQITGAVSIGTPGQQLKNQLPTNCVFYQAVSPLSV